MTRLCGAARNGPPPPAPINSGQRVWPTTEANNSSERQLRTTAANTTGARRPAGWVQLAPSPLKEISLLEVLGRFAAKFAAVSGVVALVIWVTWVMLDVKNLQSGFTLP